MNNAIKQAREIVAILKGMTYAQALETAQNHKDFNVTHVENDPIYPFFDFDYKSLTWSVYRDDEGDGFHFGLWLERYTEEGMPTEHISIEEVWDKD